MDLVFLLDGSGSVSGQQFTQSTDFVRTVAASFEIGLVCILAIAFFRAPHLLDSTLAGCNYVCSHSAQLKPPPWLEGVVAKASPCLAPQTGQLCLQDKTRLGLAQFASDFVSEFPLNSPLSADRDNFLCEVISKL